MAVQRGLRPPGIFFKRIKYGLKMKFHQFLFALSAAAALSACQQTSIRTSFVDTEANIGLTERPSNENRPSRPSTLTQQPRSSAPGSFPVSQAGQTSNIPVASAFIQDQDTPIGEVSWIEARRKTQRAAGAGTSAATRANRRAYALLPHPPPLQPGQILDPAQFDATRGRIQ